MYFDPYAWALTLQPTHNPGTGGTLVEYGRLSELFFLRASTPVIWIS